MSAWSARALGSRMAVAGSVAVVFLVGSAPGAVAGTGGTVESSVPFTVAGPVGIAAVIVGVGGLAVGLLRRRKASKAPVVPVVVAPLKVPAPRRSQADNPA
ncbi:hypothetical protein [Actinokineospora globicatena]|uniref:hypothetical protein n=1 Tax=Actinokineospora globicatena TaxID=103729 RepID=UPI0020A5E7B1|nr:hypothetical protein [Actinokineospora globicatena]GLW76357.1 hypothetical protein Aglo01_08390 [Actinokineospora globicatena]